MGAALLALMITMIGAWGLIVVDRARSGRRARAVRST